MDPAPLQWFGEDWRAPLCDPEQQIGVPVGEECARCGNVFGDSGVQGIAVPYLEPIGRELRRGIEDEAPAIKITGDFYDHLFFHRDCFAEAIGIKPR